MHFPSVADGKIYMQTVCFCTTHLCGIHTQGKLTGMCHLLYVLMAFRKSLSWNQPPRHFVWVFSMMLCLMRLFLGAFPLSGGPCQRHLRTTPQAAFQISSPGSHTWKLYVICLSLGCPGQVLPLLGWLPGSPNFPGPVASPCFECLWPTRSLAEVNC